MLRLLGFLWSGCFHVWDDAGHHISKMNESGESVKDFYQPMKCAKCGNRKTIKLSR